MTADTVVVGGGLAGCAAARFLAEAGERVLVVEAAGLGAGASGRNGGFLFPEPDAWINDLLAETLELYAELDEGPVPVDLARRPMLILAVEQAELEHARAYARAVGADEVDLRQEPWFADDLAGGFVIKDAHTVDPMSATTATAEAARRAGARFLLGCEAKRVLVSGGRVSGLATDEGIVACGRIVVAAGPRVRFVLRSAGLDLPITSARGWLLETGRVDPPPPYAVEQALWPPQAEMARLSVSPTMGEVADGSAGDDPGLVSLLLGGRPAGHCVLGTSLRRSLVEESETPETVRRLAERAARVSPHLRDVAVVAAWSARRPMTPDGRPAVGPVTGLEGLEVAAGFSSIGMATIPAACRRLVHGGWEPFDPGRFR